MNNTIKIIVADEDKDLINEFEDIKNNITANNSENGNILINLIFIVCGMILLGIGTFVTKIRKK